MKKSNRPIRFWTDSQIMSRWNNRGGRYKDALTTLILERSMTFERRLRYYVNQDIDQIMCKIV